MRASPCGVFVLEVALPTTYDLPDAARHLLEQELGSNDGYEVGFHWLVDGRWSGSWPRRPGLTRLPGRHR